jgi:hypothetical protein
VIGKFCVKAIQNFAYVQNVYTLFLSSTHQWDALRKYVKGLTTKALSVTCLESHIDNVKVIRSESQEIRHVLIEIANSSKEYVVMAKAPPLVSSHVASSLVKNENNQRALKGKIRTRRKER